jgi:tyrosine-protein phosphatase SIW14
MFPPTPSLSCTSVQFFHSGSKIPHLTIYASLVPFRCVSSLHGDFSFPRDRAFYNSRAILRRFTKRSRYS